jgi:ABC-type phosphate transport system permease subunit
VTKDAVFPIINVDNPVAAQILEKGITLYDAALLSAALVLLVVILIFNILSLIVLRRMLRKK